MGLTTCWWCHKNLSEDFEPCWECEQKFKQRDSLTIATANIRYKGQPNEVVCDVTLKSAEGLNKVFAPTADLLWPYKRGEMTWAEYRKAYFALLKQRYDADSMPFASVFETSRMVPKVKQGSVVVFTCYCTEKSMKGPHQCHRYLLVEVFERLAQRQDIDFTYLGELK